MIINPPPRFGLGLTSSRLLVALTLAVFTSSTAWAALTPAQQAYIKASNTGVHDLFGGSVAVSGDTMVVGANFESSDATGVNSSQTNNNADGSGAAYVFVRSGTNWVQQAYLKASNTEDGDSFGISVAISGETVVVGANSEASNATGVNGNQSDNSALLAGAAYVFIRSGTNWTQQAYLKASNTGARDEFGNSVTVSGDTVVVGALGEASNATGVNGNQSDDSAYESGAAYVFVRDGTNWSQQAYLKASNTGGGIPAVAPGDRFGAAVAISGDTLVVGAYGEASASTCVNGNQNDDSASRSGAAYVFVRSGTNWTQQAYVKASNNGADDYFGASVAVSGDTVVVGAFGEASNATGVNGDQGDNSAMNSGAAYVFVRSGTNWGQQAYLKAPQSAASDFFGGSVTVSGDTVVVGAQRQSSGAPNSGAANVFVRNGTDWTQKPLFSASNAQPDDLFGYSVAVSGDTVVVGAISESSDATGVNGDQNNNNAFQSGAAYVFAGLGFGPKLALVPDGSGGCYLRFAGHAGFTYRLLRGRSVTGPWSAIATNTAPASGLVEFHDASPLPGQAFYRTFQP